MAPCDNDDDGVATAAIYLDRVTVAPATTLQGSTKRQSPGLVNFVITLAYHFCLALPAAFTQPGNHLLAEPLLGPAWAAVSELRPGL